MTADLAKGLQNKEGSSVRPVRTPTGVSIDLPEGTLTRTWGSADVVVVVFVRDADDAVSPAARATRSTGLPAVRRGRVRTGTRTDPPIAPGRPGLRPGATAGT